MPYSTPATLQHGSYTRDELLQVVAANGYCVIENVLTAPMIEQYLNGIFDAYATLYDQRDDGTRVPLGLDPRKPKTLTAERIPPYKGNGIINVPEVSALQVCETLRADSEVSRVFELWHDTTALVTSFDRFSLFAPNQPRQGLAAHVDANATQPERAHAERTLQSAVILHDSAVPDQGFVVWPGHHNDVGRWNCNGTAANRNFCMIPESQLDELGTGRIIAAKAGSHVVWLSTTPHGNTSGSRNPRVGRVAVYVSKAPVAHVSDEAYATLVDARLKHTTLGHDVINPARQVPGNGRYQNPVNHRFASQVMCNYASAQDIPTTLMAPAIKKQ
jgi:hypothetical protein